MANRFFSTDDSDMKIAGTDFEPAPPADDAGITARLLQQEKDNGNLSRARRLGAILAEDVSAVDGGQPAEDAVMLTQRRMLLAFAVEVGLQRSLPNELLTETAQSVFYDTLRLTALTFFEDLQESGAFSFYYLCVRDGRHVNECVGETFASLCGRAGDKTLSQQGAELYAHFIEQVRGFADSMGFVAE